jgi:hypothetical protein
MAPFMPLGRQFFPEHAHKASQALETIYQNIPQDSDEAQAFASEYGLGK